MIIMMDQEAMNEMDNDEVAEEGGEKEKCSACGHEHTKPDGTCSCGCEKTN